MTQKTYFLITSIVFAIIALLQLVRLVLAWNVVINGWGIPMWFSIIAVIVAGLFAISGLWLNRQV